jgi:hypothetical protein
LRNFFQQLPWSLNYRVDIQDDHLNINCVNSGTWLIFFLNGSNFNDKVSEFLENCYFTKRKRIFFCITTAESADGQTQLVRKHFLLENEIVLQHVKGGLPWLYNKLWQESCNIFNRTNGPTMHSFLPYIARVLSKYVSNLINNISRSSLLASNLVRYGAVTSFKNLYIFERVKQYYSYVIIVGDMPKRQ